MGTPSLPKTVPEQAPFVLHDLSVDDLAEVNRTVSSAIETWDIAPRVKRLSLPSLLYKADDFQNLMFVGLSRRGELLGIASVELDVSEGADEKQTETLLHGLYVVPDAHHIGIGARLAKAAKTKARSLGASVLRVRAERDAIGFFEKQGFVSLPLGDKQRDYPHQLVAELAT